MARGCSLSLIVAFKERLQNILRSIQAAAQKSCLITNSGIMHAHHMMSLAVIITLAPCRNFHPHVPSFVHFSHGIPTLPDDATNPTQTRPRFLVPKISVCLHHIKTPAPVTPETEPPAPSGLTYVGCFMDDDTGNTRFLGDKRMQDAELTPLLCASFCSG